MDKSQILKKIHSAKCFNEKFTKMLVGFDKDTILLIYERLKDNSEEYELVIVNCTSNEESVKQYENFEELAKYVNYENLEFMFADEIVDKYGTLVQARNELFE